jgi:GntR family negative regulator for fad regulon and positive regulator of fabA
LDTEFESHRKKYLRPAEHAEQKLIDAILSGQYPPESFLPAERELASLLGVTRPTLREALQRLERDGWLEIHQGKPTRIRNYLYEGSLAVLASIAGQEKNLPHGFISNLLYVRSLLAGAYTCLAAENAPAEILEFLKGSQDLPDTSEAITQFDWDLHLLLAVKSGNPVFSLILNGFRNLYWIMGLRYFGETQARSHSRRYYSMLDEFVRQGKPVDAGILAQKVMEESLDFWQLQSRAEK